MKIYLKTYLTENTRSLKAPQRRAPEVAPGAPAVGPVGAPLPPPVPTLFPLSSYTLPMYIHVLSNHVQIFFPTDPIEYRICSHPVSCKPI